MCGIAGVITFDGTPVERTDLEAMGDILAHRGPDDSGIYHTRGAGLVHRRLAIIDLSPAGHGPMPNEDRTLWVTFNGEIYNYRELMPELIERGHTFSSHCDTEVILHAYEEYGERCVEHFNGMFAFAIWDERRRALFCARDRCGVKPFYFVEMAGRFAFASEIKGLLALPWVQRKVNEEIVFDYLVHARVDHSDQTFVSGVYALRAGHSLLLDHAGRSTRRYWSLPAPAPESLTATATRRQMAQWTDEFTALLTDSVRLRLRSDVTVGSCLSGGLDSSTLVCLANGLLFPDGARQEEIAAAQQTFSACFEDPAIDERPYMGAVVEATGVKWHRAFPRGEELFEQLNSIVWHQDEPFLSTSIVAQWYVMRLARQRGVTVLLDGQGADELLCGYSGYFGPFFADLLTSAKLTELARELQLYDRNYRARWGSGVSMLARAIRAQHAWLRPQLRSRLDPGRALPRWLAPDLARLQTTPGRQSAEEPDRPRGYLPATTKWQFEHGSLPSLLRYEDRNSMAFGVEARVPYLDYRLVEYVFRAPNALRIGDGMGKRILRHAARGLIPETVRVRRDKLGFTTPEATWLRGPARECVEHLLQRPSPALKNYVKPEAAREIWAAFLRGAPVDTGLIWRWVNLELWLRQAHLQP